MRRADKARPNRRRDQHTTQDTRDWTAAWRVQRLQQQRAESKEKSKRTAKIRLKVFAILYKGVEVTKAFKERIKTQDMVGWRYEQSF